MWSMLCIDAGQAVTVFGLVSYQIELSMQILIFYKKEFSIVFIFMDQYRKPIPFL